MPVTFVNVGPTGFNKTTGATLALTGAAVAAGNTVVVCATGNSSSVGNPVSSAADSGGNSYRLVKANAGTTAAITVMFVASITTPLLSTDTITVTFTNALTSAHAGLSLAFSGLDIVDDVVGTSSESASSSAPSTTIVPTVAGSLVVGAVGANGPIGDTFTDDTDTTNGSWAASWRVGSTGGAQASNSTISAQYKILTASGSQTYNPTLGTARTEACDCIALKATASARRPIPNVVMAPYTSR